MGIAERREREREQRKNDILDAAEGLFFSKGIENSTMEEVAEKAELSKGTLYLYFKSKEDIRFAIFQRGADILIEMFKRAISVDKSGRDNLVALGFTFIEFSKVRKHYFDVFIDMESSRMHDLNIGKGVLEEYIRSKSPTVIVEQCVRQGIEDGSLRKDIDPLVLTSVFWSQMLGVLMVIRNHVVLFEILNINPQDILKTHLEIAQFGSVPKP